jgi:hypothetical protein
MYIYIYIYVLYAYKNDFKSPFTLFHFKKFDKTEKNCAYIHVNKVADVMNI